VAMLCGSFMTGGMMLNFARRYLGNDVHVIAPTYDGHDSKDLTFDSRKGQAKKILTGLKERGCTDIALLQGLSMGAEVAVEMYALSEQDPDITIHRCLFDGGPFFAFPAWLRKIMRFKFKSFIHSARTKSEEEIMKNRMVRWIVHGDVEAYRGMVTDMPFDVLTDETIDNESDACYTFDFPELSVEAQKRSVFSWSSNEPARKSAKKIKAHYPLATFRDAGEMGHGGFMLHDPEGYARLMRALMENV